MVQAGSVADGLSNIAAAHDASLVDLRQDMARALQQYEIGRSATEQIELQMSAYCAENYAQLADVQAQFGELQRQIMSM